MKYAAAKSFALSLPGVGEEPHFDVPSFRVNKRIIVTVPPNDTLHVFVPDGERDMCLMVYADCSEKVLWGGKVVGIRVFLDKAKPAVVEDLILRAWKHRANAKQLAAFEGGNAVASRRGKARFPKVKPQARIATKPAARIKATSSAVDSGKVARNVDEYIAGFRPEVRARLEKVRAAIRKAAPNASESISYRIAAYQLDGVLIYFAGFAKHIGMYPAPRSSAEFREELAAYAGGKGTVQFSHDKPLPLGLITRMVKFRAAQNIARAAARGNTSPRAKLAGKAAPKSSGALATKKASRRNTR